MISGLSASIFALLLIVMAGFFVISLRDHRQRHLLHRLYLALVLEYAAWIITILVMWLIYPSDSKLLQMMDSLSYVGSATSPLYLLISYTFTRSADRLPKWGYALFIVPLLSILICLTNDWHHLYYRVYSVFRAEIEFGPFMIVNGAHSYICLMASFVMLISFAWHNRSRLYAGQCAMLILGGLFPFFVSVYATFSGQNVSIAATPLSFALLVVFNGIAIYRLNILDITPVAAQHVLDWISDCYLLLSSTGLVLRYNKPFASVFASAYGITENRYLKDCIKEEDISNKTAIYNIMTAVDACREAGTTISYEQAAIIAKNDAVQKNYYITDVSQLLVNEKPVGYVVIFKDITQLKKSMQQLQDSRERMMEQERFAFLGQMIGGLAHNLKTPIMSISGCVASAEALVDECLSSLEDPEVNNDDYREIYGEMSGWFHKILDSTAYMSDIITAIKGQATSVSTFSHSVFTVDELFKRTTILMRHELLSSGCSVVTELKGPSDVSLHGDINNLVQVLGNLLSNAIYAQKQAGGGIITVGMELSGPDVRIYVRDTGSGIPDSVRSRLFREMTTSKGAQGTGLGLYISNTVVQGKFGGSMWCENNPGGGATVGMTIPVRQQTAAADEAAIQAIGYER